MSKAKYKLVKDGDGHWYLISPKEQEAFDEWLVCMDEDRPEEAKKDFEEARINCHPSNVVFENPVIKV